MDDPLNWSAHDQEQALQAIAPWYDLDFGPLTEDVELWQEVTPPEARVLELGAGSGRIAVPLAQAGARVTAVDSSEAMLAVGTERMLAAGVDVVTADMRSLDLVDFDNYFNVAIFGFSTFQHLLRREDQLAALRTAERHLAPEGLVVIDWTAPRPDDVEDAQPVMAIQWTRQASTGETVTKSAAQQLALDRQSGTKLDRALPIAWITYQFDALNDDGQLQRSIARFPLRVNLTAGEMAGLLHQAGLKPIEWFGSWSLGPAGQGDRLIVIAQSTKSAEIAS